MIRYGYSSSLFNSIAIDSSGNVYATGYIFGTTAYNFGNNITVIAGPCYGSDNIILVKYDSNGDAQLARLTGGDQTLLCGSTFLSATVDSSQNVYAAGYIIGVSPYSLGNGVTVGGACDDGTNVLLVKYENRGNTSSSSSSSTGGILSSTATFSSSSTGEHVSSTALSSSSSSGEFLSSTAPSSSSSSSTGISSSSTGGLISSTSQSSSSSTGGILSSSSGLTSSSSTGALASSTGIPLSSTAPSSLSSTGWLSSSTAISSSSSTGISSSSSGNNHPLTENAGTPSWIPWTAGFGGGAVIVTTGLCLYKYFQHSHAKVRGGVTNELTTIP